MGTPRDHKWKPRDPRAPVGAPLTPAPTRQAPGACILDPKPAAKAPIPHLGDAIDILHAAVADAMGHGWQPRADAARGPLGSDSWSGTFTVGHRRFRLLVELDYGEAPETALEEMKAEAAEAESNRQAAIEEREEMEREAERLKDRLSSWEPTVTCALEGDGEEAVEEAKMIPKSERP